MRCRICKGKLKTIIDFGKIGLVGNFYNKKKIDKKFKISLNFCSLCKHVQIGEKLNPDALFKNYLWETGVSKSNITLIKRLIKTLKKLKASKKSKIFEIACNDGIFLNILQRKLNCFAVGMDPARNLAKKNKTKNVLRIVNYFNKKTSKYTSIKFGKFDFVIARNVLAHVKNPNEIFKGAFNILNDHGILILEFPSLLNIIKNNQYDNIFHEHIGFHSLKSILDLCKINNMKMINFDKIDSQGGSLRCYVVKKSCKIKISNKIKNFVKVEKNNGLYSNKKLISFKDKINAHRVKINSFIKDLKKKRKKISAYGASGKGLALLQYCKIDNKLIDEIYDKSKLKQNKFTAGTQIFIKNPLKIRKQRIDYLLLLSWNLKKEIIKQEKKFRVNGGKFIVPFPSPRVIK
tara:strand:- start:6546 stop:7757 length:1212 start_codon:yes stop_codon:yes gene_type:complete